MAWRINESVKRGEVDNRQRGRVTGRIWLEGRDEPIRLELRGNACVDLAGCWLTFENPGPTVPFPAEAGLAEVQQGSIGDLTASRKVRVLDVSVAEARQLKQQGLPVPEHWANSLYLEWFSEANGRVVVESADYRLTMSPSAWRLSLEEEQHRQQQAAEGWFGFMDQLEKAFDTTHLPSSGKAEKWDEFDYEKLLRESDAHARRYRELLDRYRDHPEAERLIAQELGWSEEAESLDAAEAAGADERAEGEPDLDIDDEEELDPDPATEGVDWVREADGNISHPLVRRTFTGTMELVSRYESLPLGASRDPDLLALIGEYQMTCVKLAGALNSLAYGRDLTEGAFVVACLKRALKHLHAAQTALEKASFREMLPVEICGPLRREFFAVREEMLRLMEEFRRAS